ncbi:MAG: nucleotidyltransferase family protein [Hyphomonadaceae bacterium]|nr:nucleotidyltransferase family protein [Hyphomonadaceae bacterium]
MLAAIVLAAGAGRRFGGGKMSALFEGVPLVHHAIAAACASPAEAVYVVVGDDALAANVLRLGKAEVVLASKDSDGMAASLRAGIEALPDACTGALIFLGDMPRVPIDVAQELVEAVQGDIIAAAPIIGERSGHPVLFARAAFSDLLALKGDVGAKSVLKALGGRVRYVPIADEGALFDVDTPEDLA